MSYLEAEAAIISIAQHASPNPIGQIDDSRAQFSTRSMLVVMKLSSNLWSISPIQPSALGPEVLGVSANVARPFVRCLIQREDGLDRTGRHAGAAVDAFVGM